VPYPEKSSNPLKSGAKLELAGEDKMRAEDPQGACIGQFDESN
jgi:hypothetical protein